MKGESYTVMILSSRERFGTRGFIGAGVVCAEVHWEQGSWPLNCPQTKIMPLITEQQFSRVKRRQQSWNEMRDGFSARNLCCSHAQGDLTPSPRISARGGSQISPKMLPFSVGANQDRQSRRTLETSKCRSRFAFPRYRDR